MAKQLVNPIERHVEKAVVGLAAVLLIGAIAFFGVTSPNKLELGNESVTPSSVDGRVLNKAMQIRDRIRNADATAEPPELLAEEFIERWKPLSNEPLPRVARIGPEVPLIDRPETPIGQMELVKVVKPESPRAVYGRSTLYLTDDVRSSYQITNWVTVSALFNVKHQSDVQMLAYGAQYKDVITGPFQLQRREQRPDGTWSDEDWTDVTPWPAAEAPAVPNVSLVREGDELVVSRSSRSDIDHFYGELSRLGQVQLELYRPLMPEVVNGTPWKFPALPSVSYEDVLRQDDYFMYPDQPPADFPEDRYGLRERPAAAAGSREKTVAQQLADVEKLIKEARADCNENMIIDAYNTAAKLARADSPASPAERDRAQRLRDQAEQAERDIIRDKRLNRCGQRGAVQPAGPDAGPVREPAPIQQFWLHDARPGSVIQGRTYQYRVRAQLFNQLAGDTTKFADPRDAARVLIPGEWSDPTDPVFVPPSVEFYVTSDEEKRDEVSIEIFQWSDGVWVRDRFRYTIGDAISGKSRQRVPSLDDPTVAENPEIEFQTGATIVGVDFKRNFRDRRRGRSRTGFTIGSPQTACAVAYLDADGRLRERMVSVDKAHPGKQAAMERVARGERIWRK
jgi:hypothetical protein